MNDKIKRLAKNITELLTNTETPQETYYSLLQVMRKQKDYFQHMSPDNIIKLLFYCYSYGQTKSFEESTDEAIEALRKQLLKEKEKME